MSKKVYRGIANLFICLGLALIALSVAMAYPFVRDALQAQSAASSLSFVVTLEPTPVEPAQLVPASTSTPTPIVTEIMPTPTAAAVTATPIATVSMVTPTATLAPTPAILPNSAAVGPVSVTVKATTQPASVATGGAPDRIVIPAIRLDAPVVVVGWHVEQIGGAPVSVWDVPNWRAAGWLKTSAPAGQKGNTVLDGHHNIAGQVFRYLVDLKPQDEVLLYAGDKVFRYRVTEKYILPDRDQPMEVRIANAKWIQPTDDERLTLVTCWPYTNNTHRVIIVARPNHRSEGRGIE